MATYLSVTDGYLGEFPTVTLSYKSPCSGTGTRVGGTVGSIPAGTNVTYEPQSTIHWRNDPTKDQRRSWSKIKRSKDISMTPLRVGKETTRNFIVPRVRQFADWKLYMLTCNGACQATTGRTKHVYGWTENSSFDDLVQYLTHVPNDTFAEYEEAVNDAISTSQTAAFASSLASYDVLTELAEGRETLAFLSGKVDEAALHLTGLAHKDENAWKKTRLHLNISAKAMLKSTDKAIRRLGGRWMEYRYAIMPLIYSMSDYHELLLHRSEVYKTDRKTERVTLTDDSVPSSLTGSRGLYDTFAGDALIRTTVKTAYNRGALQRVFSNTFFNPFKTAWELIPLSFVIDWFVNVNDVITSATSVDFSSQKRCVTSVKQSWTKATRYRDYTYDWTTKSYGLVACHPAETLTHTYQRSDDLLLRELSHESYDRFLWSQPTPELSIDPYLNWKRFLDSIVLSRQPISKLLRSL